MFRNLATCSRSAEMGCFGFRLHPKERKQKLLPAFLYAKSSKASVATNGRLSWISLHSFRCDLKISNKSVKNRTSRPTLDGSHGGLE